MRDRRFTQLSPLENRHRSFFSSYITLPTHNMSDSTKAWVTLLTKTSYLQGCLVLQHSLVKVKSKYPLVVFATPELPNQAREILQKKGIRVRDIKYIEPPKQGKELDEHDQRFADTWTKLRCFEMTEYEVSSTRLLDTFAAM